MDAKTPDQASPVGLGGCLKILIGFLLAFAAIEGGIVIVAASLHQMLGRPGSFTPMTVGGAAGGIVLAFMGPRLLASSVGARPDIGWRQALAALPDFALAGWFVLGWAAPQAIGKDAAGMLVGVMVLEFIIIHASVMLVALPEQVSRQANDGQWWKTHAGVMAGLMLLYSLFAAGISAAFGTVWLFFGFWLMIANKFIADWLSPPGEHEVRKQQHLARWSTSAGLYLLLVFGSIFIPVPTLGAFSTSRGDGLWETHPEQAVAMGAMYFAILAFCELYGGFRKLPAAA